jgi:alkanesulfonate monooxygenase SsuD/methylene tetrahydromethanopterin reductase-like flavin-dependent oxidoreductase (luciferase family)
VIGSITTSATTAPTSSCRSYSGACSGSPYDFEGRYYRIEGATVMAPPDPIPPLYFGGASDAADFACRVQRMGGDP